MLIDNQLLDIMSQQIKPVADVSINFHLPLALRCLAIATSFSRFLAWRCLAIDTSFSLSVFMPCPLKRQELEHYVQFMAAISVLRQGTCNSRRLSNGVPHPELQKLKVTAAASGKGQLVFGDSDGCITVSTGQAQRKQTQKLLVHAHACVGKQMGRVGSCRTSHRHLYAGN